ncbi:MFS transporter [Thalassorhabdomicrobium marinisediminis]|uniref:MFS transporter n=1 Tax=Thalassorhabdomicrobium marinisediminis TaxID=2170577 RepID=UPI0024919C0D|nr:MFS transporter [Thalassorhabdomicrobium marinisediminis]
MDRTETGGPSEMPHVDPAKDPIRWRILAVLLVTIFMTLISVSIVNVALPSIGHGLSASQSDMQWVLSGYALTFGVVLVAAGRAGDIMGRGGLFLIGVGIFTVSSIAAGMAPDAEMLNLARFAQGIGSGLLNPQGLGMIQHYFRGAERGRALGYMGTSIGLSIAVGPVLGGLLIELGGPDLGWRLTFLVNVPIGIASIVLGLMWFPRPLIRRFPTIGSGLRSLDPVGAVLLGLAVLCVLFPFVEARNAPMLWGLLPFSALLLWLWIRWERRYLRRGFSPMVDFKIFRSSSYTNGILIMSFYFMGLPSLWVLVALYVQEGVGATALQAGFFGVPAALIGAYTAQWAGNRVARLGSKLIVAGLILTLVGLVLSVAVILLHEVQLVNIWWLMASLCFVGVAQGIVISPNQTLTLETVPLEYAGSSGAILQTGQRIGTAIGFAVITAATFSTLAVTSWSVAVSVGFGLIAVMVIVAFLATLRDIKSRRQALAAAE